MIRLIWCVVFLLTFKGISAEQRDFNFRHLTNKQGLSHNTVYCAFQDQKGFMWFGTENGLNRFDGKEFKQYSISPFLEDRSRKEKIIDIHEDANQNLWICMEGQTGYFNPERTRFVPIRFFEKKNLWALSIASDSQQNMWMLVNEHLVRYREDLGQTTYPFRCHSFHVSGRGEVWIGGTDSLYRITSGEKGYIAYPVSKENISITAVCPLSQLGILVGTGNNGLLYYDLQTKSLESILSGIRVRDIHPYGNYEYWIASEDGIYIYNMLTKKVVHLEKNSVNDNGLNDNAVYSFATDSQQGIWVCTFFGGVNYKSHSTVAFNRMMTDSQTGVYLQDVIRMIEPDEQGFLWVGTENNGLHRYNPRTGETVHYAPGISGRALASRNIHGLLADGDYLWIGYFDAGIEVMERSTGKIVRRFTSDDHRSFLNNNFVLSICRTRQYGLLIGTASGIQCYDEEQKRFFLWKGFTVPVKEILEDSRGDLWISTLNGVYRNSNSEIRNQQDEEENASMVTMSGMVMYAAPIQSKDIAHYFHTSRPGSLGCNEVTSVFEDSKGEIWVLTSRGLYAFDRHTDEFHAVFDQEPLCNMGLYRMLEDINHHFWISSSQGLIFYDVDNRKIQQYDYRKGVPEPQFNFSSSYKDEEGQLFFGTINGMMAFRPHEFEPDICVPDLFITNIDLMNGESFLKEELKDQAIEGVDKITLPYNKSSFRIDYTALNYAFPEGISFAYRMDGLNEDWVDMGANRTLSFYNLSPGSYMLHIRSTNSDGIWQNNERVLYIHIRQPFWNTVYAWLLYILAFLGFLWGGYRYKRKRLEEKHELDYASFERQKEKELYDAKIRFFTFITHEIRTPLTLIKAPLDKIMRTLEVSSCVRENLEYIESNTNRMMELSNQLLDLGKIENKGFNLYFMRTDLNALLKSIILPFVDYSQQENKKLLVDLPEDIPGADVDSETVRKIVTNLLSNAFKYGDKLVRIRLSVDDEAFEVQVTNDGALIPEEEHERIFEPFYRLKGTEAVLGSGIGLSIVRSLAEFHRGTIRYFVTDDSLNGFCFRAPIRQSDAIQLQETLVPEQSEVSPSLLDNTYVILVVEDQKEMRGFLTRELGENYTVIAVNNGIEALDYLQKKRVHLIVSDLMMPLMDGMELCRKLKSDVSFQSIPFIILTAQHTHQTLLEGLKTGADAYLMKPFTTDILIAQIENLIHSRELLNRNFLEQPLINTITSSVNPQDRQFMDRLNLLVDKKLADTDYSIEILAADMGVSTSSLYRKMKGVTGMSPVDFIKLARLKKSVSLIEEGLDRINEISAQAGFSSASYFSTCFQKQYGVTPSECIRKRKEKERSFIVN